MKKEERYRKAIDRLKKAEPVLEDKESLTEEIMKAIAKNQDPVRKPAAAVNFIFGWTQNPWMRLSMAAATLVFAVMFSYQQIIISQRISGLEKQLSKSEQVIPEYENSLAISQRVLLKLIVGPGQSDSVKVSKKDLEKLLNSYMDLQENYQSLTEDDQLNPAIRELIRQNKNEGESEKPNSKKL